VPLDKAILVVSTTGAVQSTNPILPPLDQVESYLLCLCGALRERKPPFRHFDEKGFMRRSTSCLRQSNAFSRVLA
jgi:hypothetical protein